MSNYLACVYAFLACVSFCFVFQLKKPAFILAGSAIGAVAWAVYVWSAPLGSAAARNFLATVVMSILAEVLARWLKAPATIFLVIGIIPLVPGGGLYYTMDALLSGDMTLFVEKGMSTAACAGAIAVGVSMVTSVARILFQKRKVNIERP